MAVCHCAVLRVDPAESPSQQLVSTHRQKRTLGLLQLGANVLSTGVGAAGGAALTAAGAVAAAQPLILLGLGAGQSGASSNRIVCSDE